MKNKSLVSITDYSKEDYLRIIALAEEFENHPNPVNLKGQGGGNLVF